MTIRFDLGNDLDLWIFKIKCDLDLWPYAWCWPRIFMVKFWNSCISGWEGRLTMNKGDGTMTIWWPRSGVRIYNIVTGVTSDVGMPSTLLVPILVEWCKIQGCFTFQTVVYFSDHFSEMGVNSILRLLVKNSPYLCSIIPLRQDSMFLTLKSSRMLFQDCPYLVRSSLLTVIWWSNTIQQPLWMWPRWNIWWKCEDFMSKSIEPLTCNLFR